MAIGIRKINEKKMKPLTYKTSSTLSFISIKGYTKVTNNANNNITVTFYNDASQYSVKTVINANSTINIPSDYNFRIKLDLSSISSADITLS